MSNRLIGIVGFARVGKDTVGDHLVRQHGFTRLASGDLLRDVLYGANAIVPRIRCGKPYGFESIQDVVDRIGWDRAKVENPEVRRLLQDLGTEGVRRVLGADTWINETLKRAALIPGPVVITDTRFPNEAKLTKAQGGIVWRVDRPGVGPVNGHSSERFIMDIEADYVIPNDGTVEDLYARVDALVTLPAINNDPWPGATALGKRLAGTHFTGGPARYDVI